MRIAPKPENMGNISKTITKIFLHRVNLCFYPASTAFSAVYIYFLLGPLRSHPIIQTDLVLIKCAAGTAGVSFAVLSQFTTNAVSTFHASKLSNTLDRLKDSLCIHEVIAIFSLFITVSVALSRFTVLGMVALISLGWYMSTVALLGKLIASRHPSWSLRVGCFIALCKVVESAMFLIYVDSLCVIDGTSHQYEENCHHIDSRSVFLAYIVLRVFLVVAVLFVAFGFRPSPRVRSLFQDATLSYTNLEALVYPCAIVGANVADLVASVVEVMLDRNDVHIPTFLTAQMFCQALLVMVISILPSVWSILEGSRLKGVIKVKGEFSRYISHEIRSPLSSLSLGLAFLNETLRAGTDPIDNVAREKINEVVMDCTLACEASIAVVSDMLLFDKIEQNLFDLAKKMVSPHHLVAPIARQFHLPCSASGISLNLDMDADTLKDRCMFIDKPKVQQVLRNFLTNAIKFTGPAGSISIKVTTEPLDAGIIDDASSDLLSTSGDYIDTEPVALLVVSVTDSGVGISKENLPLLFGQYVQFDANLLQGGKGSGLGMWLSREIIRRHAGGLIGAVSELKKGSTFFFKLPCYDTKYVEKSISSSISFSGVTPHNLKLQNDLRSDDVGGEDLDKDNFSPKSLSEERAVENSISTYVSNYVSKNTTALVENNNLAPVGFIGPVLKEVELTNYPKKCLKVLVADDVSLSRKMVGRVISPLCRTVDLAENGRDAVDMTLAAMEKEAPYDVVIMDYFMPIMNGAEAVKRIRHAGFNGVALIVSGVSSNADKNKIRQCGCDEVLEKPLNIDAFRAAVCGISTDL